MSSITQRLARVIFRPGNRQLEAAAIERTSAGYRNMYGEYVEGSTTTSGITVITTPLSGQERLTLVEGLRSEETRNFWTKAEVAPLAEGNAGDVILWKGGRYRSMSVEAWGTDAFSKVLGVRIQA